jgi:hypothetical protein
LTFCSTLENTKTYLSQSALELLLRFLREIRATHWQFHLDMHNFWGWGTFVGTWTFLLLVAVTFRTLRTGEFGGGMPLRRQYCLVGGSQRPGIPGGNKRNHTNARHHACRRKSTQRRPGPGCCHGLDGLSERKKEKIIFFFTSAKASLFASNESWMVSIFF